MERQAATDTAIADAQAERDKYIKILAEQLQGKRGVLKVETQKEMDPYAYQKRLMDARTFNQKTMHMGRYYHDLAFSRTINEDATHIFSKSIRYS